MLLLKFVDDESIDCCMLGGFIKGGGFINVGRMIFIDGIFS